MDFGYSCLTGKCGVVPTGLEGLQVFKDYPWLNTYLPGVTSFVLPYSIIIISYVIIWRHIKKVKADMAGVVQIKVDGVRTKDKSSETEIRFIWTVFIVCVCYLITSTPLAIVIQVLGINEDIPTLIVIGLTMSQYSINIFIYAYRSEQYRSAYWDIILLIFPCLPKLKEEWQYHRSANTRTATKEAWSEKVAPSSSLTAVRKNPLHLQVA